MGLTEAEQIAFAQRSLAYYMGLVHRTDMPDVYEGWAVPRPHHMRMIARLEAVARTVLGIGGGEERSASGRHTSIVAPPGSGKTTVLQCFYEWMLGLASLYWEDWQERFHIAHVSHSADQAWRLSFAVRDVIMANKRYQAVFPKVKPHPDKFSEREWRVEGCNGIYPSFAAMGVGGPLLGLRLNVLGLDDLIKQEDVKRSLVSASETEAVIDWIRLTGMRRLVDGGCAVMLATRWLERDPSGWAGQDAGWHEIVIRALDDEGRSFWPERGVFSTEALVAERERDPEGFALQFMGEPVPEEGLFFKRVYFEDDYDQVPWLDAVDRQRFLVVDSWDTAGTRNPRSDYTAGWTAAVDTRSWDVYLLNLYHDKVEFNDLLDAIRGSHFSALMPQLVLIEDKSTGQPAAQLLRREGIDIMPVKPFGERGQERLKDALNQVRPMLAAGRVHLPSERFAVAHGLGWRGEALRALLSYPRAVHDDIPRALVQLLYKMIEWQRDVGIVDLELDGPQWGRPAGRRLAV